MHICKSGKGRAYIIVPLANEERLEDGTIVGFWDETCIAPVKAIFDRVCEENADQISCKFVMGASSDGYIPSDEKLKKIDDAGIQIIIAHAVVHMDEDSPHMHVVGVPVGTGYKKGMSKQVFKRKVFTKEVLSIVLQDELRAFANQKVKIALGEQIREKAKDRNHD